MFVKLSNITRKIIFFILLVVMIVCGMIGLNVFSVFADSRGTADLYDFEGVAGSPDAGKDLYNATNTFSYYDGGNNANRSHVYYNTSVSGKILENTVSTGAPMITVLTHGLGGDASTWSNNNNGNFAYDPDSLIIQLKELLPNANVYWAKMDKATQFKLIDLEDEHNFDGEKYIIDETLQSIKNNNGHHIIVFEATVNARNGYNYQVYEEFNYMLSKIVYDVKYLNGGVLPKINLIGHSRGGITNLMYALDHPEMVASMFSIGTPLFGSDTANTEIGKAIGGDGNGLMDIIDSTIYTSYYNRWKTDYSRLYSNINVHALGGYSDTDFIFNEIISMPDGSIENLPSDAALRAIQVAIKVVPAYISANFMNSVSAAAWAM